MVLAPCNYTAKGKSDKYSIHMQTGICNGIKFSIIAICFNPVPLYNVRSVGRTELVNHFIFKRTAALLYHSGGFSICFVATHKNFFITKVFSLFCAPMVEHCSQFDRYISAKSQKVRVSNRSFQ